MRKIKRVGVLSAGLTYALVNFILTLIIFALFWFSLAFLGGVGAYIREVNPFAGLGTGVGAAAILMLLVPLCNAVFGFIFGILAALIYNLVAKATGGIKVQLDPVEVITA